MIWGEKGKEKVIGAIEKGKQEQRARKPSKRKDKASKKSKGN